MAAREVFLGHGPAYKMTRIVGHKGKLLWQFHDVQPLKSDPDYDSAKAGDLAAAARLVMRLVDPALLERAKQDFGRDVVYVAVHAEEARGRNKIPSVLAEYLSVKTGAGLDLNIVQSNRVYHTGAKAMERLLARAEFAGDVQAGKRYVLVDDVTTMGSTLANLAGYVQGQGGEVAGSLVLTNAMREPTMVVSKKLLRELEARYGQSIRDLFGIEPESLTASEAGYLIGFRTADELRNRAVKARQERDARILSKAVQRNEGSASDSGAKAGHVRKAISLDALRDRLTAARDARFQRMGEERVAPSDGRNLSELEEPTEPPLDHPNLHPPPDTLNRNDFWLRQFHAEGTSWQHNSITFCPTVPWT